MAAAQLLCRGLGLLVGFGVALLSPTALADDVAPETRARALASDEARSAELEQALADVQRPTRTYFTGWLAALGVMTAGQVVIGALSDDAAVRESSYIGAGLSVIGAGCVLVTPLPGRYAADELRALPATTPAEKRAKRARGEALLREDVASVHFVQAWYQHALGVAIAGGLGLYLGLRYPDDVWSVAVPSAALTLLTSELQIWTRPTAAVEHLQRYEGGAAARPVVALTPWLGPQLLGVSLRTSL